MFPPDCSILQDGVGVDCSHVNVCLIYTALTVSNHGEGLIQAVIGMDCTELLMVNKRIPVVS